MTFRLLLLILASVSISALAQIALKMGMSGQRVQTALEQGAASWHFVLTVAAVPFVWLGLAMYLGGALVWLMILARLEVSLAYPFVGLGFVFTMLLGFFLLGETISLPRITGTLLVVIGVVLISRF